MRSFLRFANAFLAMIAALFLLPGHAHAATTIVVSDWLPAYVLAGGAALAVGMLIARWRPS